MKADEYDVVQGDIAAKLEIRQMLEVSFNLADDCDQPITEEQATKMIDQFLAEKRRELSDQDHELGIWWRFLEAEWMTDDVGVFLYTLEENPPPPPRVHIHITER